MSANASVKLIGIFASRKEFTMRWLVFPICLSLVGSACLAATPIEELAQAVEANEKHYKNLALVLTENYEYHRRVAPAEANAHVRRAQHSETRWSITVVGSSFRRHTTSVINAPPDETTFDSTSLFDGTTYQYYGQNATQDRTGKLALGKSSGLISEKQPSLTNFARPHMFLCEGGYPEVPLSAYVRGHKAVLALPNPGYVPKGTIISTEDRGNEVFQELNCRVIYIDSRNHGAKLWLAEGRNYIPVRKLAYTYRWSKSIPIAESIVEEWTELRPGVWFPKKAHTQRYDSSVVQNEGRQETTWRETYEVQSVSLEPQTTPETFTKLDFPPGTEVRIESDESEK